MRSRWIVAALVVVVVAASVATVVWRRHSKPKRSTVVHLLIPADVDGDGTKDLILVYDDWMKAVSVGTKRTLWEAQVEEPEHYYLSHVRLFDVGAKYFALSHRRLSANGPDELSVSVHALGTGKRVWTRKLPGAYFGLYRHVWIVDDLLVAITRESAGANHITAFELATGHKRWSTDITHALHPSRPLATPTRLLLFGTAKTMVIERKTGKLRIVAAAAAIKAGKTIIAFRYAPTAKRYAVGTLDVARGVFVPMTRAGFPVLLPEHASTYDGVGYYKGRLIALAGKLNATRLAAIALDDAHASYSHDFGGGFVQRTAFFSWKQFSPDVSPFQTIESRYMPLVLRRNVDENHDDVKWVIFDLDAGKVTWQSRVVRLQSTVPFTMEQVLYLHGDYYITFPYPDAASPVGGWHALVVLDGRQGKFRRALELASPDGKVHPIPPFLYPWNLSTDRFYGLDRGGAWVVDLAGQRIVYSSTPLAVRPAWADLAASWGPLPH